MSNSQASKKMPAWMQSAGDLQEMDPEDNVTNHSPKKSIKSSRSKQSKKVPVWMGDDEEQISGGVDVEVKRV